MYKVTKHRPLLKRICDILLSNSSFYNLRKADFTIPRFSSATVGTHSLQYRDQGSGMTFRLQSESFNLEVNLNPFFANPTWSKKLDENLCITSVVRYRLHTLLLQLAPRS